MPLHHHHQRRSHRNSAASPLGRRWQNVGGSTSSWSPQREISWFIPHAAFVSFCSCAGGGGLWLIASRFQMGKSCSCACRGPKTQPLYASRDGKFLGRRVEARWDPLVSPPTGTFGWVRYMLDFTFSSWLLYFNFKFACACAEGTFSRRRCLI